LHQTSQILVKKFQGQLPNKHDILKKLPGFGPYTTNAVLSFAFDLPYPVIDANVRRVVMRLMGLQGEAIPKKDKILIDFLMPYLPRKNVGTFNQALMELGALVCRPRNALCLLCPLTKFCQAYEVGTQEIIPSPKKKIYLKIEAVVGIIKKKDKYLIQKRPSKGLFADLWEFPGGKIQIGERVQDALYREIKEELSMDIENPKFLIQVNHSYTNFRVTLYAYECRLKNEPQLKRASWKWVTLKGLRRYPFPSGSAKIIHFLEKKKDSESQ
jgi:A/G-specific adenine glycosylase